ncbi:hypothetical protein [Streptomyces sp. NPDC018055]|uniref:hypothetical protein n=1 Tax=Streptomyces sp. NPDC018055 TaxID=3365038 RepID=UPI0037B4E306
MTMSHGSNGADDIRNTDDLFQSLEANASPWEQMRAHGERLQATLLDSVRITEVGSAALEAAEKQIHELQSQCDSQARELKAYRDEGRRRLEAERKRREAEEEKARQNFVSAYASGRDRLNLVPEPQAVVFFERTPGASIRYLAMKTMDHADGNAKLIGIATALDMVAENVDRLLQDGGASSQART